jgi:hypothetical protein
MRFRPDQIGRMLMLAAVTMVPVQAQGGAALEALSRRLEQLERQNTELQEEVRLLRQQMDQLRQGAPAAEGDRAAALEERLQIQEGRLAEQDQVKVETTQRVPVRLTGMALFNLFTNGRHSGGDENATTAAINPSAPVAGASFRQSVLGLEFNGPEGLLGGRFRGQVMLDLFSGSGEVLNQQVRLRTAFIEGQWKSWGILVGQEKPIMAPREPNSLAQVGISPLTAAGNLWRWRPQVRLSKTFAVGPGSTFEARVGVSQTYERGALAEPALSLEPRRPAYEGRFQFAHSLDDFRRIEIAPGFHWSNTHVGGFSIPASAFTMDWLVSPHRRIAFTGAFFSGQNLAKLGGGGVRQGFTAFRRAGVLDVIPVRTKGGWAQITLTATSRLSFNFYSGLDDPDNRDLAPNGVTRNQAFASNLFYKLGPNVVVGGEISRVRTRHVTGQRPINNHYDVALAYLF